MNFKVRFFTFVLILNSIIALSQSRTDKSSFEGNNEMNLVIEKAEKFYKNKNFKKAIDMYTVALNYNENLQEIYTKRGGTFFQIGDYENAINDFTKVIELKPENPTIYFMRGLSKTLVKKEDKDGACLDIKKAIDLGYDVSNLNGLDEYCNFKK